jgi:hypothetical protein
VFVDGIGVIGAMIGDTVLIGAGTEAGTEAGTGTAPGTGAGTTEPSPLSIQKPARSKPTQSPTKRFEQSKYGRNSVSEMTWMVQLLQKSENAMGSLGFIRTVQLHVSNDRAVLDIQLVMT